MKSIFLAIPVSLAVLSSTWATDSREDRELAMAESSIFWSMIAGRGPVGQWASAAKDDLTLLCERAGESLESARASWPSLLEHYRAYPSSCDDGYVGEGYSDAVVTLLARKWDHIHVLAALSASHPDFKRWAIKHIDESTSLDDLKAIARSAARCSDKKVTPLCKEIAQAAARAIVEAGTNATPDLHLPPR